MKNIDELVEKYKKEIEDEILNILKDDVLKYTKRFDDTWDVGYVYAPYVPINFNNSVYEIELNKENRNNFKSEYALNTIKESWQNLIINFFKKEDIKPNIGLRSRYSILKNHNYKLLNFV